MNRDFAFQIAVTIAVVAVASCVLLGANLLGFINDAKKCAKRHNVFACEYVLVPKGEKKP